MRIPESIARFPWLLPDGWIGKLIDRRDSATAQGSSSAEPPTVLRPKRLGLVLSCGGARGLSHVGVIQVLEEAQIPISAIYGTSMGAYVGALWASGVSGPDLEKLAAEIKDRRTLLRLLDPVLPPMSGFIYGHKIRKHLERTLGADRLISDLSIPMGIMATNLDTAQGEMMPAHTPVSAAVHASSAIPGICAPVTLHGNRYVDGGASHPLPVGLMRACTDVDAIIAVNVMVTRQDIERAASEALTEGPSTPRQPSMWRRALRGMNRSVNLFADGNVLDTFKRCLTSAQMRLIEMESQSADVLIHPYVNLSKWYDYENFSRYIEAGRRAALDALPQIHALLSHPVSSNPTNHNDHEIDSLIPSLGCGSPRVLADVAGQTPARIP